MKDPFNNIERKPLPQKPEGIGGLDYLDRVAGMQVGQGSRVMRMDKSGMWLGAATFAAAPFSVDMSGNLIASTATFGQYLSKTGTSQSFTGSINVLNSRLLMDGVNGRIVVNDGATNRIVIGDV